MSGFAGSYLIRHLLTGGVEVWGSVRAADADKMYRINDLHAQITLVEADLLDQASLVSLLTKAQADVIYHLAGISSVAASWRDPAATIQTNVIGTLHLLEAIREQNGKSSRAPLVILIGSSEEYGRISPEEVPVNEQRPLQPINPYGISKVTQEMFGEEYVRAYGLKIVLLRAFNHIGPRQDTGFVTSDFARQVALIEAGQKPPIIEVGDLSAVRDFTDVRDIVAAYRLAGEHGTAGEAYNICSKKGVSIREILEGFLSLTKVKIEIRQDPAKMRPTEVPVLIGDNTKIHGATGWRPVITLKQSLQDILDFWRRQEDREKR